MTAPTAEQFMTGGGKSAKLERVGDMVKGTIIDEPQMMQQRDYETNDPIFYADGAPAMQLVIRLQTDQRDPSEPDDDGIRCVYVRGQLKAALVTAMRSCDHKVPRRGGRLAVRLINLEPTTLKNGRKGNDKKIHDAWYQPPAGAAADSFMSGAAAEPAAAVAPPGPAAAPISPAPAAAAAVSRGALPCPQGIERHIWATMSDSQRSQAYTLLGLEKPQTADATPAEAPSASPRWDDEPPF